MTIYIALNIAYAALILCGVALLLINRRIKKIEKKLAEKKIAYKKSDEE